MILSICAGYVKMFTGLSYKYVSVRMYKSIIIRSSGYLPKSTKTIPNTAHIDHNKAYIVSGVVLVQG